MKYEAFGVNPATSSGTEVTSGAATVKGAWTQLIASTGFDYNGFTLKVARNPTADCGLIDIAIGPAGSETVIVANLPWHLTSKTYAARFPQSFDLPLRIPAGSRIAARVSSLAGNGIVCLSGHGRSKAMNTEPVYTRATTYGASEAACGGTLLQGPHLAVGYSSWVEFSAAASSRVSAVAMYITNNDVSIATGIKKLYLARGAAGSEKTIIDGVPNYIGGEFGFIRGQSMYPMPVDIPAGERIACRAYYATADGSSIQRVCVIVMGFE